MALFVNRYKAIQLKGKNFGGLPSDKYVLVKIEPKTHSRKRSHIDTGDLRPETIIDPVTKDVYLNIMVSSPLPSTTALVLLLDALVLLLDSEPFSDTFVIYQDQQYYVGEEDMFDWLWQAHCIDTSHRKGRNLHSYITGQKGTAIFAMHAFVQIDFMHYVDSCNHIIYSRGIAISGMHAFMHFDFMHYGNS